MGGRWKKRGAARGQQTFPPLPVLSHRPCRGLSISFPGAGRAQKGTRGCHWAVPGRDPALVTLAGSPVVRGGSVLLAWPQRAGAGEDGLLAGRRDSPGTGIAWDRLAACWGGGIDGGGHAMLWWQSQHMGGILLDPRLLVVPHPGSSQLQGARTWTWWWCRGGSHLQPLGDQPGGSTGKTG